MQQKSLQHITVGMIPYTRYRCMVCGMRYAACGMRQIESLHVAIHAASECRIGRGNPRMASINYDIPEHPLHSVYLSTVKIRSEMRTDGVFQVGWLVVSWLIGWLIGCLVG